MADNIKIFSLYWNNVSPALVEAQKKAFNALGFTINQCNKHGVDHGVWIESVLNLAADEDVIVIVDIDCVPLTVDSILKSVSSARQGNVYGCAQSANHIDYRYIYAAPMFLALSGKTWRSLGRPSMQADSEFDVGGRLTHVALEHGVQVELVYPSDVAVPKWRLGDRCVYGLFTVYEGMYLHLFESRNTELIDCFVDLVNELAADCNSVDVHKYVLRASIESHEKHALKYFSKNSFSGKIRREWLRIKKRTGLLGERT